MIWIVGAWTNLAALSVMVATSSGSLIPGIVHDKKYAHIPYWFKFASAYFALCVVGFISPVLMLVAICSAMGDD
jgi:hypothetical protein